MNTQPQHSLAELQAMPDDELNALTRPIRGGFVGVNPDLPWHPTTNRNQSGELLATMTKRGAKFLVTYGADPGVDYYVAEQWQRVWREDVIEQPTARDETIAAILAHEASEKL